MAKTKKATTPPEPPAPSTPVTLPEIDGGGDPEFVIYVERHDGLIPYLARSDRKARVFIGGTEHLHVSEHEGCWVYRRA